MAEIVCDTSFLIHLATRRIRNIDRLDVDIGQVTFVVPEVVRRELDSLARNPAKRLDAEAAMDYAKGLRTVPISGTYADRELVEHARAGGAIIATTDRDLKRRVKEAGGSVMSLAGDSIVLEP